MKALREKLAQIDRLTISDAYRAFYQLYASRFNKRRWGDKTPDYCLHMETIETLLPEAHFIHLIRDGRDVALSLREMWFSPGQEIEAQATEWSRLVSTACRRGSRRRHYMQVRYEELILDTQEVLKQICEFIELEYDAAMLSYHERAAGRLREHKVRFRTDGSPVVTQEHRQQQQWKTTEPPDRSRVFSWKREMTSEERARFEAVVGGLLKELGYD